jgi:hypothetical protein
VWGCAQHSLGSLARLLKIFRYAVVSTLPNCQNRFLDVGPRSPCKSRHPSLYVCTLTRLEGDSEAGGLRGSQLRFSTPSPAALFSSSPSRRSTFAVLDGLLSAASDLVFKSGGYAHPRLSSFCSRSSRGPFSSLIFFEPPSRPAWSPCTVALQVAAVRAFSAPGLCTGPSSLPKRTRTSSPQRSGFPSRDSEEPENAGAVARFISRS